jgi:hypothetical protein
LLNRLKFCNLWLKPAEFETTIKQGAYHEKMSHPESHGLSDNAVVSRIA